MSPTLLETYGPGVPEKPSEERGTLLGLSPSPGFKPGQLALSRLTVGSVLWGDSLLLSLSVTEAANHVRLIFICRCSVLLSEGVESERATTNLGVSGGQQPAWPSAVPAAVAGFSSLALTAASRASTAFPGQLHGCRLGDTRRALSELEGTRPGGLPQRKREGTRKRCCAGRK